MAATPEKKVKQRAVQVLKDRGAYYFYPVTGGFGASGVPDIIACYKGRFIGIECKAGKNKPTELQKRNLNAIADSGGIALVIAEDNLNDLVSALEGLDG
ncbi:MAG TPA: VRR-NUC domain-containing protein [Acidimicrobiia bacterium]